MNPSRFWGKDLASALRAVRGSFGPDALIIETRSVPDQSGGGIEILALSEKPQVEALKQHSAAMGADNDLLLSRTSPEETLASQALPSVNNDVREELAALRSMLAWLAPGLNHKNRILKSLVSQGLDPEVMLRLSEAMNESQGVDEREKTYHALKNLIPTGGQIPDAVDRLALIGPTGVGKTSSIIKLTVFESQRLQRRVAWLNCDHRRIASGDPLALYATILNVQYETVANVKEAKRAWERFAQCDLILIDTPGITPRDAKGLRALARLFQAMPGLRRALVLSASTNCADIESWITGYQILGFDSLFFTKLDECQFFGSLVNTAIKSRCPLSYVTLGQNISGDIEAAKPSVLTSLLLSGSKIDV